MDIEILRQAGLTNNESLVYKALLELGPSLAGQISRRIGLHRRTVYDTTEMLIKKGLVGYIVKNNRRLFEASSPNVFLDIIKEKESQINSILPEMLTYYQKTKEKQETNFYKGKAGLKTVFEDQIETGEEILVLGASPLAYEILQFYFKWFDKKRKENKIKTKIIFTRTPEKMQIPLSEIKYLPQKYSSPLAVNIYGDKVAIILWSRENPIAIVIKNKEISDGYRKYFELMWRISSRK
ncbi:MAG: helix-turn-helix domain-containing protein [Candidatus Nanoarchaeia archaeon]|nr:helix-turn-helix domain-containing protein [Candidatus Nanoarchaeia archaeon]MDD5740705.1 helix-turn-helix domain-containing protein [Candidatus Nanoarchaeia archaeon]